MNEAEGLIEGTQAEYLLADKGYDANRILQAIEETGAIPVIPPKKNRIMQREYDKEIYKERNWIERLFNKLKQFRRVATRYEKSACCYLGFVYLAATLVWLR